MTKIDVISGFLGAGKTTFIKKLIAEALKGEKVVLIENEFGEIAIDGGFLKDAGIEIREMSQGCICCSLVGDFEKALHEVITRFQPERVIIEPSGVGKLSDVMKAVTDASANLDVVLNSAVTIVDAKKLKVYMKNFGEFFNNQVQYAGTVVLSRTDIADQALIDADVAMIRELNAAAEIVTTPLAELKGERLLEIIEKRDDMLEQMRKEALNEPDGESEEEHMAHHHHHHHDDDDDEDEHEHHHHHHHDDDDDEDEHEHHHHHHHDDDVDEDEHEHHHHHHHDHHSEVEVDEDGNRIYHSDSHDHHHHHHHHGHDADEVFQSWGMETPKKYTIEEVEAILARFNENDDFGIVLRSKGMVPAVDGTWIHFDYVPDETEVRTGAPDVTGKICVIGSGLKEAALADLWRNK